MSILTGRVRDRASKAMKRMPSVNSVHASLASSAARLMIRENNSIDSAYNDPSILY